MGGEGIGPEIVAEGAKVLRVLAQQFGLSLTLESFEVGERAYQRTGHHLPREAELACDALKDRRDAAILFGAVSQQPIGLLRKKYDLFANVRPIRVSEALVGISRLKAEYVRGVDMLIVRELTSGIYYGKARAGVDAEGRWALQEAYYHEREVRRICRVALELAQGRKRRLTWVHKGNVIPGVFGLWREVLAEEQRQFADVVLDEMLVDTMAMQMVLRPRDFDVLLCSNLFGDILSDLGGGLVGSVGLLPSASFNSAGFALYESVGGTAPDIAGRNLANPSSTLLSVAMLCRHTLRSEAAAQRLEAAVEAVLMKHRTQDIWEEGCEQVSTSQMGELVVEQLRAGNAQ